MLIPKLHVRDNRLGKFIREKRIELNFTQQDLATALDYSPQFIANWERGASSPPAHAIHKIVKILNISEEEILQILVEQSVGYWKEVIHPQQLKERNRG
jgi:transcriptional regulator with XRE-family HTH domain